MFVRLRRNWKIVCGWVPPKAAKRIAGGSSAIRPGLSWLALVLAASFAFLVSASTLLAQNTLSTVSTGATSRAIAVNPTQNIVYVTQGDNTLTYIDGWTNTVHKFSDPGAANTNGASAIVTYLNGVFVANSISNDVVTYFVVPNGGAQFQQRIKDPSALQPVAMASNPNGFGSIYVVNKGSNSVSVFVNSGSGLAFSKAIPVGTQPTAIAENVATNTYYVTNSGDGTVSVIDGGTSTVVSTVDVSGNPGFLAVNAATNKTYVGSTTSNTITVIDSSNNTNSINGIANNPGALAVNPLTNQVYVATLDGKIYIINGSTDTVTNSVSAQVGSAPGGQAAIVVDSTTNIAYATIQGGNVTTVDGGTFATTNPPVGPGGASVIALNPVTHRVYVDSGNNGVTVIDGSSNAFNTISPSQSSPWSLAVNPASNKIYVANSASSTVTVIDGSTNAVVDTVVTGANPRAIAVDPVKNLIFTANFGDATATIMDGSNDHTASQPVTITNPNLIAVNPLLAQVHGASSTQSSGFNFASSASPGGFGAGPFSNVGPVAVAFNPAAGMSYTLFQDKNIEIDDESAPHSFVVGVCGSTNSTPTAMDFNPNTNTIYIACAGNEITVLQNASGFFGGNQQSLSDSSAISPVAVAVNPVSNKIFVANAGDGSGNGSVTVIDGATNAVGNLPIGGTPVAIAVNVASGKVYVQMITSGSNGAIYVIDPTGQFFLGGSIGEGSIANFNAQIAVNPINNTVYALDRLSNTVSTVAENTLQAAAPAPTSQPFPNNTWSASQFPVFTFNATTGLGGSGPYSVYYQVDSRFNNWNQANSSGVAGQFSGTSSQALSPGFHVVYAFSVNGNETNPFTSAGGSGFAYNPFVGGVSSYGFLVAPPNAGTTFFPSDFGTQAIGGQTAAQQPLLSNHGGVPLNFTYAVTGPNAADFIEVPYTGTDKLCNSLAGALPSGTFCDVNIAFHPSIVGSETATLTFTDNSLGAAGSTQIVTLSGVGSAAPNPQLTVSWGGSGNGSISDGVSLNCTSPAGCSHAYTNGTKVTLTATPSSGAVFTGWSGACTGTGTCVLTMNSNQAVTANFYTAGAAACGTSDTTWIGGATGNWSTPTNWSTGIAPNSGVNVCINNNHAPAASVTLDISASIGKLTINPGNSLTVNTGLEFSVSGTIANSGLITVLSSNGNTFFDFNGAVTLTGGGTFAMSQLVANGQPIVRNTNNGSVTNVNNTIQGAGQLGNNGLIITNLSGGTIKANGAFPLLLNSGTVTNQGTLEAAANATLQIYVLVINKGGTLLSTGTNANLQLLSGSTVRGGAVSTAAGGILGPAIGNSTTLDGSVAQSPLTVSGTLTMSNQSETILAGTINNTGTMLLASNNANTFLDFSGAVTLTGGGTLTLNQAISNGQPVLRNVNNGAVTNVNNLIQGSGQFGNNGLLITNQAAGVINANGAFPLQFNSGTVTNLGLIEATAGGNLQVYVKIINGGATISSTGAGSFVQFLSGAIIQAGTLTDSAGGVLGTALANTVTLDGSTAQGRINLIGTYTLNNQSETVLVGTINNTGTMFLVSNNANTFLDFSGAVTLTGGGTVTLNQVISNGQPVLRNLNSGTVTNVNNLIQGSGQFGNNGLLIINQAAGVINANGAFPLQFNSGTVTNLGLVEATAGGNLQVYVKIINGGANILSSGTGSNVQLLGGTILQAGTLTTASGGVLGTALANNVTLDGSSAQGPLTIVGTYTMNNQSETVLVGTINNIGAMVLLSNNANTFLDFSGPVTLTGNGRLTLTQAISNGQPVLRNVNNGAVTNVNNLIQGSGQFGNNGLLIINQAAGVINANGAFPLQFNSGTVTNQGLVEATGGSTLQVSVKIINAGATVLSTGTGSYVQLLGGTIIQGGTLRSASGGVLGTSVTTSTTLDGSSAQGPVTIAGTYTMSNQSETVLQGAINNTGTMLLLSNNGNTFIDFSGAVTLTGGGTLTMSQAIANGQPILRNVNNGAVTNVNNLIQGSGQFGNNGLIITNGATGVISANGAFPLQMSSATFTNQGLLVANGVPNPGAIPTAGYTQTASGRFEMAIGGITPGTQYSQLQNSGTITLAGALDIVFLNGFHLALGNQFTVLTAGAINGQFASVNSPALPSGLAWSVTYNPTSVLLSVIVGSGGSPTLTLSDLGTGTGTVTDDLGLINCTTTGGVISGTCSALYTSNSIVVLTATPASRTTFSGWNACAGTGTCSVIMNGSRAVSATFVPTGGGVPLNVSLIGTGNGTITDNFGQINCVNTAGVQTGTCSASYAAGTVVALNAAPVSPSTFGGWGNACSGTGGCTVTMTSAQAVTASFAPAPQLITLSFPSGTNVTGMATYDCP